MLDKFFEITDVAGSTFLLNIKHVVGVEQSAGQDGIRIYTSIQGKPSIKVNMSLEEFRRTADPGSYPAYDIE